MMRVIGYVRVSTDEQATNGCSLAAQAEKLRAYAGLYDLELVDVIEDAGQSAKNLNRPGIQQALEMLRTRQVEGLLVAKLDRLTRSVSDMAQLLLGYFGVSAKVGAKLLSVSDQLDTRTSAGCLVLNILTSVAAWEREAIGERTKAALQHLKSQGVKLGAPPLDDPATLARIHELRAQGLTFRAIAAVLVAEGFKTQRGGRWAPETVRRIVDRKVAA